MSSPKLQQTIAAIRDVDSEIAARAAARQAVLTKPAGSLGRLEHVAERVCAARRTLAPSVARKAVAVFAADHGVCAEQVSAYPASVTGQMVGNFVAGGAAICALTRSIGAALVVVDVGVTEPCVGVRSRRVRAGTANFAREPAMSRAQAVAAIEVGIEVATSLDVDLLGVGEMGIGNTTAAAAIASVMADLPPAQVTGRGTGLDDARLAHKITVIQRALALHRPDARDPVGVLAAVGGLEIAAIAGACLGAAATGRIVVLDGFIATAGAVLAAALAPLATGYMVAGHRSVEPGHARLLERLRLVPVLELDLRLGEGSGAALAMPIIDGAVAAFRDMATFEAAGVENRA
ncbi:MAG TPA: nicotinate-nucleotide--dimethylbenzimidazole phosphoribosyltransferase [Kofleriaceae bacterium]|nr:nicotinate-nucleotide--dimethylbenzimidazole phosphoribosyltransferase [Kofleriaceae bacterium]